MTNWWTRWRAQLALATIYVFLAVVNWIIAIDGRTGGHLAVAIAFTIFAVVFFVLAYVTRRRTKRSAEAPADPG